MTPTPTGVELIAAERARQVSEEGWTAAHDDGHTEGELAMAAACYASPDLIYVQSEHANGCSYDDPWPFDGHDKRLWRGSNLVRAPWNLDEDERIALLVKAGALIAAEIDRLKRLAEVSR